MTAMSARHEDAFGSGRRLRLRGVLAGMGVEIGWALFLAMLGVVIASITLVMTR